ncbi:hypothetical protein LXL04_003632 [Taraxacum kok-saghyz]
MTDSSLCVFWVDMGGCVCVSLALVFLVIFWLQHRVCSWCEFHFHWDKVFLGCAGFRFAWSFWFVLHWLLYVVETDTSMCGPWHKVYLLAYVSFALGAALCGAVLVVSLMDNFTPTTWCSLDSSLCPRCSIVVPGAVSYCGVFFDCLRVRAGVWSFLSLDGMACLVQLGVAVEICPGLPLCLGCAVFVACFCSALPLVCFGRKCPSAADVLFAACSLLVSG